MMSHPKQIIRSSTVVVHQSLMMMMILYACEKPNCQQEQQLHSESHEFNTGVVQSWHIEEIALATTDLGLLSLATAPNVLSMQKVQKM